LNRQVAKDAKKGSNALMPMFLDEIIAAGEGATDITTTTLVASAMMESALQSTTSEAMLNAVGDSVRA
jgi:hypothetical protein